jgi:plasmid stability protein
MDDMAGITIRELSEDTMRLLRIRAAQNGRSMEREALDALQTELARAEAASARPAPGQGSSAGVPPAVPSASRARRGERKGTRGG